MAVDPPMGKMKAIVASYVGVLFYAGLVFLGAGKIAYWQGLLYVVLALVGTTLESHPRAGRLHYHRRSRPRGTGWAGLGQAIARACTSWSTS